jgi:hypothetical protein
MAKTGFDKVLGRKDYIITYRTITRPKVTEYLIVRDFTGKLVYTHSKNAI